jgi:hypothetical protein
MNDDSLSDPRLQSLEARLAAMAPQVPLHEQQQLLYQCGVAAGRKATRGALLRWRVIAASLLVVAIGLSVPRGSDRVEIAEDHKAESEPVEIRLPRFAEVEIPEIRRGDVELDAWQAPRPERDSLADELARFEQTDQHLRSLTVGAMMRSVLRP